MLISQYYKDVHCPFEKCQDAQMSSVRHCQERQKHGGAHKAAASCSFASEPRSFKLSFVAELLLAAARQQGQDGEEKQLCSRHNLSPANREGKSNTAATCQKKIYLIFAMLRFASCFLMRRCKLLAKSV